MGVWAVPGASGHTVFLTFSWMCPSSLQSPLSLDPCTMMLPRKPRVLGGRTVLGSPPPRRPQPLPTQVLTLPGCCWHSLRCSSSTTPLPGTCPRRLPGFAALGSGTGSRLPEPWDALPALGCGGRSLPRPQALSLRRWSLVPRLPQGGAVPVTARKGQALYLGRSVRPTQLPGPVPEQQETRHVGCAL